MRPCDSYRFICCLPGRLAAARFREQPNGLKSEMPHRGGRRFLKSVWLITLALALCSASLNVTRAQRPSLLAQVNRSQTSNDSKGFVSIDGRFAISLPKDVNGFRGLTEQTPSGTGDEYMWNLAEGAFSVGYIDYGTSGNELNNLL